MCYEHFFFSYVVLYSVIVRLGTEWKTENPKRDMVKAGNASKKLMNDENMFVVSVICEFSIGWTPLLLLLQPQSTQTLFAFHQFIRSHLIAGIDFRQHIAIKQKRISHRVAQM